MSRDFDLVVVGSGNAGLCAALAGAEAGARVLVIERAPEETFGGNSRYTSGSMRFAFEGLDHLRQVMRDVSDEEFSRIDFGRYSEENFFDDMFRVTNWRTDPDLCERLVRSSFETVRWLADKGVRYIPRYTHAFKSGGLFKFTGSSVTEAVGGGAGLVERERQLALRDGVAFRYGWRAITLLEDDAGVCGVRIKHAGGREDVQARAVVLACGGFEANAEWRARYIGSGWDIVKVRGTRFNTGDGLRMALDVGAAPYGHWSGCHAVSGDAEAPDPGDPGLGDIFQRHSYPLGIMVNAEGRRFVDEGADIRHYTYAKYGRALFEQPGQIAWQIFDAKVSPLLREEYRHRRATKIVADTLDELASRLEGMNAAGFLREVAAFNAATPLDAPFDPAVLDGRCTNGLALPKSNWANQIDAPPFEAYPISCGITFTFGGLRVDPRSAQALGVDLAPIPGLYAAGEMVGGLFYFNYPGGTGLTSGAVFGRLAGSSAAAAALAA